MASNEFQFFLRFFSNETPELNKERAKRMMIIADFFMATIVIEKCTNYLVQLAVRDLDTLEELLIFANDWFLIDLDQELQRVPRNY